VDLINVVKIIDTAIIFVTKKKKINSTINAYLNATNLNLQKTFSQKNKIKSMRLNQTQFSLQKFKIKKSLNQNFLQQGQQYNSIRQTTQYQFHIFQKIS
jgi:hypothetical protein